MNKNEWKNIDENTKGEKTTTTAKERKELNNEENKRKRGRKH